MTRGQDVARRPDVVVDFVFEEGLLFVSVANIGDRPALKVTCNFEPSFRGLDGRIEISSLALFRRLEFLPPGKEIRAFVDRSGAYFARKEPRRLAATVRWRDPEGARYETTIRHDLSIYRDLAFVPRERCR